MGSHQPKGERSHHLSGQAVDSVLKTSAIRRSADNITVVFIAFDGFYKALEEAKGDLSKFEPSNIEMSMID